MLQYSIKRFHFFQISNLAISPILPLGRWPHFTEYISNGHSTNFFLLWNIQICHILTYLLCLVKTGGSCPSCIEYILFHSINICCMNQSGSYSHLRAQQTFSLQSWWFLLGLHLFSVCPSKSREDINTTQLSLDWELLQGREFTLSWYLPQLYTVYSKCVCPNKCIKEWRITTWPVFCCSC